MCRIRPCQYTRQKLGMLCALAASIAGCGLSLEQIRIPTRPDNANTNTTVEILATDAPETAPACVALASPRTSDHQDMFDQLNAYRVENGLNPLQYSQTLERASDQYALRMSREGFFDHVAPDGSEPSDRALAAGFCDRYVGENLAYGRNTLSTAGQAMQGFKDSPHHNENMLREQWTYVGIGVVKRPTLQGIENYWVQLFGTDQSTK